MFGCCGALLIFGRNLRAAIGRTGKIHGVCKAITNIVSQGTILTIGTSIGLAELPIGCFASRKGVEWNTQRQNPMLGHITTFGGHPVVCAAAAAGPYSNS